MAPSPDRNATSESRFTALYNDLRQHPAPLLPPASPHEKSKTHEISDLLVHPTLEVILHLLNNDLPSAHFLVRHMQAAPQYEGMYLHGILHRIEGDYDNARAWYGDVADSDVFQAVWGHEGARLEKARDFIQRVQDFKQGKCTEEKKQGLEQESAKEIEGVLQFCKDKFGTRRMDDVSDVWVQPTEGKVKDMKQDMLTGDKGHHKF